MCESQYPQTLITHPDNKNSYFVFDTILWLPVNDEFIEDPHFPKRKYSLSIKYFFGDFM